MLGHDDNIEKFIKNNFQVCKPEEADIVHTNASMLEFLFTVFPADCINDFQLYDILMSLGYEKRVVSTTSSTGVKYTFLGWPLKNIKEPTDVSKKKAESESD